MTAHTDLLDLVRENVRRIPGDADVAIAVDVHFFKVLVSETFDRSRFRELFHRWLAEGDGEFAPIDAARVKAGPSYIEWGRWVGDQGAAMELMAAGQVAGLWQVMSPRSLGIDGAEADLLAGQGFVMTSGLTADEVRR